MTLFDTQSMEWTPAAHVLALVAGMLALSGLMLMFPCLTRCFYKVEPHTQKVCKNRLFELSYGAHILYWSCAIVGGLVAGGAQVTCILLLPSMLVWTGYHYSASSKPHAVMSFIFAVALAYFGFVPFPTMQALRWTPAAIFLTMQTALTLLAALPFLIGGKVMDAQYEQKPWIKDLFCDDDVDDASDPEGLLSDVGASEKTNSYRRSREIALGAQLMGAGCCQLGAIISGGAQDMCLLAALPLIITGYCHWLQREFEGEKATAIFSWFIVAAMVGFGMAR
jgi:hypothetical protein